ncbi:hypothetical protein [Streptomyces sp. NPDC004728]|uniref:hypothetical protein n=1 Tax=Streptomyces sp. NPDC004728 TaxID=3154289 RepID=UPI0033A79C65
MSHRIVDTFAVAVTVTPPAVAFAVADPYDDVERVTHIHIGIPTTYFPAARGLATFGPTSFMASTARRATSSGSIVGAAGPAAPVGTNVTPTRQQSGQCT